ncbi:SepM family pheromone-processing serine protease [Xylocopilactobacillus apicola]|uniref:endopeptidase La n=1 Tax=Xylocopilactobacillus apicola TaxID=2932184 RepID=A0AAU9DHB1_9LACO|nr:SepM family pheromone-processing serine protease [Xylocopilactobacillus apicola]BDR59385.1 peptidase S16 [Xylocopilactobacillus apicola]
MINNDSKKEEKRNFWRNLRVAAFIIILVFLLVPIQIPTQYYIEGLGDAKSLKSVITVDGNSDKQEGALMYTDVGIRGPVNLLMLGESLLDPHSTIIDRESVMGDQTSEEYNNLQQYYMQNAENTAISTAFKKAGEKVHTKYLGVYVMSIDPDSQFKNKLKIGDTIIKVDDQKVSTSDNFRSYLDKKKKGQKVTIQVKRNNKSISVTGGLIKLTKHRAGVGIVPIDHTKVVTDKKVNFDMGDVGGPSAGLMFTLELYTILSKKNLRHGEKIAGTGTIEEDGTVGAIGGIDKKIVSADRAGAKYFIAPDDTLSKELKRDNPHYVNNYHTALDAKKKFKLKIKIIPVKTFDDAVKALEKL